MRARIGTKIGASPTLAVASGGGGKSIVASFQIDLLPESLLSRLLCLHHSGILGQLMLRFKVGLLSDHERPAIESSLGRRVGSGEV